MQSILLFIVLTSQHGLGQDKIYLSTSTRQGKITAITAALVTYRPTQEKTLFNIPLSNVVLLINDQGGYLVPAQLDFGEEQTKQAIQRFLTQNKPQYTEDRIYSIDGLQLDGNILDEDDQSVTAVINNTTKKIPKNSIVIILYKNGRHSVLGNITDAKEALVKSQNAPGKPAIIALQKEDTHSSKAARLDPVTNAGNQATEATDNTVAKPASFEELAGNISKKDFENKATQKTNQFSAYLKLLCDKSNPQDEMNKAIDQAVNLFVNEDATVETSSVNRTTTRRTKIRNYLRDVKMLAYDKIELEWSNVQYVNDVRQAPDGTWRGIVTFEQTFSGYRDGLLVYKDITKKSAEVVLKTYNKNIEGQQVANWDVLLSDVGVTWTQKTTNQ
jgi:hypothetical protein